MVECLFSCLRYTTASSNDHPDPVEAMQRMTVRLVCVEDNDHIFPKQNPNVEPQDLDPIIDCFEEEEEFMEAALNPTVAFSQDQTDVAVSQDQTDVAASQDQPTVAASQEQPAVAASQDQTDVAVSQDQPTMAASQEQPAVAASQDQPAVGASQDQPPVAVSTEPPSMNIEKDGLIYVGGYICHKKGKTLHIF